MKYNLRVRLMTGNSSGRKKETKNQDHFLSINVKQDSD
jgi:hypothetical protein